MARVTPAAGAAGPEVTVEGVLGHPGALLSGWAEGASAVVRLHATPHGPGPLPGQPARSSQPARSGQPGRPGGLDQRGDGRLAALIGTATVAAAADLAGQAWRRLGDTVIEWAADDRGIWLLQSRPPATTIGAARAGAGQATAGGPGTEQAMADRAAAGDAGGGLPTARARMPVLAATVLARGEHIPGRPGAPGTAAGRLLPCRPHERPAGDCGDAILLIDRPLPALAPLLFAARGVIARAGAPGSHLAEVARSLGVPMVLGSRPERAAGVPAIPDGAFLAAIDGSTGDVALLPAAGDWLVGRAGSGNTALSDLLHPASVLPAPGLSGQRM